MRWSRWKLRFEVQMVLQFAKNGWLGPLRDILPDGIAYLHLQIYLRSLAVMDKILRRDIYDLQDHRILTEQVPELRPPLSAIAYLRNLNGCFFPRYRPAEHSYKRRSTVYIPVHGIALAPIE